MSPLNGLVVKGLSKSFDTVQVLKEISFTLLPGEIHALVGANGAGKSTLINVLSGLFTAYEGTIEIDGTPITLHNPAAAHLAGIRTLHQEFDVSLFPSLSAAENLLLQTRIGMGTPWVFPPRGVTPRLKQQLEIIEGGTIPLDERVSNLRLADRQKLAIAIALDERARFLIFDEPTASISPDQADHLLTVLKQLRARGMGILYVSHHLNEVFRIANRISVLRDGRLVDEFSVSEEERQSAWLRDRTIRAMLNKEVMDLYPARRRKPAAAAPLVTIRNLTTPTGVTNVNLEIYPGEVVALTGLVGAGKTELVRALFALDPVTSGEISWEGKTIVRHTPRTMIRRGTGFVPEDRHHQGLHLNHSVLENLSLPFLQGVRGFAGGVSRARERALGETLKQAVGLVAPSLAIEARGLSGGNQQKVVFAKWLQIATKLLILDEPTKGVDVGARSGIYRLIRDMAERGVSVLMATSELDEAIGNADRIMVMHRGRIVYETSEDIGSDALMSYATGGKGGMLRG